MQRGTDSSCEIDGWKVQFYPVYNLAYPDKIVKWVAIANKDGQRITTECEKKNCARKKITFLVKGKPWPNEQQKQ